MTRALQRKRGEQGYLRWHHITRTQTFPTVQRRSESRSHPLPDKIEFSAARLQRMRKSRCSWFLSSPGYVHLDPGVCRALGTMRGRPLILGVTCCCSVTKLCLTLRPLPGSIPRSLLRFMSIESVMPSRPAVPVSSCPQSFPASGSFPMS